VTTAFDSVFKIAKENKIPLFAGSTDLVKKGAIATYGVNYYEIGKATGRLAANILKNNLNPGEIPVVIESKADLVINKMAAELLGVSIPETFYQHAVTVFNEISAQ
jgi:putative ABC transport system substrate-binding protein